MLSIGNASSGPYFAGRSFDFANDESLVDYQDTVQKFMAVLTNAGDNAAPPSVVAEVIWTAVTDGTNTLRYTAGEDAKEYMANRKALDDETFIGGMTAQLGLT